MQRVLVYGVTGSGKSVAAARLGDVLGLPVTFVDELTWHPGWVAVPTDEQRAAIARVVAGDGRVLDGAYSTWLDLVVERADLVVGLDYPRWLSFQRLLRRTLRLIRTQQPTCNGNTETWRQLWGRESILRWHVQSFPRKRRRLRAWAQANGRPEVLLFRRPRELEAWIAGLDERARRRP
ncbi:adenylate kinase [Nocardioides lijunqiniae]|uniref:adenylate kinase n=1 Tax=Nocardioides lijunqiniae TaxID=2760832 RepID=UPI001877FAC8|nr:adenylate kinase [Nocardioides lijunqiniae]